jgi:hypothetical protein
MSTIKWKVGLAVATLSVAGFACGPDNNGTNNGNAGTNGAPNGDTNGMPNGDTNGMPNGATNGATNGETNSGNGTPGPMIEPLPKCGDPDEPPRCQEDPSTIEWGSASVINDFYVEGTDTEPICCFDYQKWETQPDDEVDNSLGTNLAGFGFLTDINDSVLTSIEGGSLVLVLEHDGLDELMNDDEFTVNFWIAEHAVDPFEMFIAEGGNQVLLDPQSFDSGAQPQAYLPDATLESGAVAAGPGSVKIEIELFDSPLQLIISEARIEADVDAANSDLADTTGVALTSGQLGGFVQVRDIFVAVNEFATNSCDCLGLDGADLVDVETGMCTEVDASGCVDDQATCGEVADACSLFQAVGIFADIDVDGDTTGDAVSIGATFTAVGAEITGVAEAQ